jgi:hypothetical protein
VIGRLLGVAVPLAILTSALLIGLGRAGRTLTHTIRTRRNR